MAGIVLHEVGPRDGLQMEKQVVPLDRKEAWTRGLLAAGIDIVQVGSFVHPGKVPQMADTDELFRRLSAARHDWVPPPGASHTSGTRAPASARASAPGPLLSGLVLNEKGLERGAACGVDLFCMGVSASDTHSRKNTGMTTDEALRRIVAMGQDAVHAGKRVQLSVQSAFGCGFEGPVPAERVLAIVAAYVDAGFRQISLADTAGHAHPAQVRELFTSVRRLAPDVECTCHFHDTYGLGMANIYAAMAAGVTSFETSFAGLGGCPFTRVAAGNVATEDFVHALQRAGTRLDVDLDRLIALARDVASFFGREMPGRVHRTGSLVHRDGTPAERP